MDDSRWPSRISPRSRIISSVDALSWESAGQLAKQVSATIASTPVPLSTRSVKPTSSLRHPSGVGNDA